jgi:predicted ATPase
MSGVRPSGIVTFLFTDIEGSTKRWTADPEAMSGDLAVHDDVLRTAVEVGGGWLFKHTGDGVCAAFSSPGAAVDAAIGAQRLLGLPVRMGIATGEAEVRGEDYFGSTLNLTARVMDSGHGGQILVASSTASLVSGVELADLGFRSLRDLLGPVQIFQVRAEGLQAEFPALRTMDVVPGNLPAQSTSFVGRDDALKVVSEALDAHRVVTLTGVGGVGKTRLALQSAALVAERFRGGVWLVELAAVSDGSGVEAALASLFMVQPQPGRSTRDVVIDALRGREVLLVIDNCEHVLDDVADLVEALVASCPRVRVLVTSRESLSVGAEWAWRVPSLPVRAGSAGSMLFVERAASTAAGFEPDGGDLTVIAEICERLDGIPLAIELAAARVRSMSPSQIRDMLGERFRLLTGSRRSIERHQTLRHAVQWSYDLLKPVEQTVLQRASVFAGGFDLPAGTAVCNSSEAVLDEFDMLDVLDSLVRKSLLHVDRSGDEVRYAMLETIRQFAEELLAMAGDGDATRDAHAGYFADRIEAAMATYLSPDEPLAYRFVDTEIANLAAAFRWAADTELVDQAIRLAVFTHEIARNHMRTETFGWAEEVIELAREHDHRRLPDLLTVACDSATGVGRIDDAIRFGLDAIELNDDARYEPSSSAYIRTGFALTATGDIERALSIFRAGSEHPADPPIFGNLAFLHIFAGIADMRFSVEETNDAIVRLATSTMPTIRAAGVWVQALNVGEDTAAAIRLYQQAIDMSTESGNRALNETLRGFQMGLLSDTIDVDTALTMFTERVNTWQIIGDNFAAAGVTELANMLARLGYHDGAARLHGAINPGADPDMAATLSPFIPAVRDMMGADAFNDAYNAGTRLSPQAAGELAHQLIARARAEHITNT